MATSETDIQKMFQGMDGASSVPQPPLAPQSPDRLHQMFRDMDAQQPSAPASALVYHSMFQGMDAQHPDNISSMFEKMDAQTPSPRVTSTVGEDAADLQTNQVVGGTASAESPVRPPSNVVVTVPAGLSGQPSQDEITEAALSKLGYPGLLAAYQKQTGRSLSNVGFINQQSAQSGYDPQSDTYSFTVNPTVADMQALNRAQELVKPTPSMSATTPEENRASIDRASLERGRDQQINDLISQRVEEDLAGEYGVSRTSAGAFGLATPDQYDQAVGERRTAMMKIYRDAVSRHPELNSFDPQTVVDEVSRLAEHQREPSAIVRGAENVLLPLGEGARSSVGSTVANIGKLGKVAHIPGAQDVEQAGQSLTAGAQARDLIDEPTAAGKTGRTLLRGVGSIPGAIAKYETMGAPGMMIEGAASRSDEGVGAMVKGALEAGVPLYGMQATGEALSPVMNAALWTAAPTAVDVAEGQDLTASLAKNLPGGVLAGMSGKGGSEAEPEFASTRPLADAPATPSMVEPLHPSNGQPRNDAGQFVEGAPAETFTHPVLGKLTATADQSGIRPDWVRVTNEDSQAPFVVRRPNPQGTGGVTNADNPDTANAAPVERTPSTTEKISNILNVPRAIQTSLDTHSLFRQAAVSFGSHPIQTLKTYFQSLPALWSERSAGEMLNDIQSSPLAPLRQEAGLYLADYLPKSQPLTAREENLMTNLIGKIPGVRGTQRQFVTFLDKIRADSFDAYANANPDATLETLQGIARFINYSTGRGDLGSFGERHALGLSNVFYSPRFAVSRAQLLTTPFRGTPEARAYAAKELVRYVGTNIGIMALAKTAGLDIGINPLSNDFGTMKAGNTRLSLWGGTNQLARYTAQLLTGQSASADSGNTRERSRLQTALTFLRTKAAPQAGIVIDAATGTDFKGQPVTVGDEAKHLLMPISWNDIADAVRDDQANGGTGVKGAAVGSLGLLGAGVQTVPQKTDAERLSGEVEKLKADPANSGLSDDALTHNATVKLQVNRLLSQIDNSGLGFRQQEIARRDLNTMFYYSYLRPGDRRALSSVQRVFNERLGKADDYLKQRIEALKGK